MNQWHVWLHPLAASELDALPPDLRARFWHIVELVEAFGPMKIGMPHIRPLESKLWEMRMQGRDGNARAIYFADTGRRLLVLHVFTKKTRKTPRAALETARRRKEELK
jgi:phage-related protein